MWLLLKMAIPTRGTVPTAVRRQILRGKLRRFWLVYFRPRYVREVLLPRRKSLCHRTGACCQMGFGCPAFDAKNKLCKIHPHKPLTCKLFPLTQEDLKDRDIVYPNQGCGYYFDSGISFINHRAGSGESFGTSPSVSSDSSSDSSGDSSDSSPDSSSSTASPSSSSSDSSSEAFGELKVLSS